jgi:hypothetical protein
MKKAVISGAICAASSSAGSFGRPWIACPGQSQTLERAPQERPTRRIDPLTRLPFPRPMPTPPADRPEQRSLPSGGEIVGHRRPEDAACLRETFVVVATHQSRRSILAMRVQVRAEQLLDLAVAVAAALREEQASGGEVPVAEGQVQLLEIGPGHLGSRVAGKRRGFAPDGRIRLHPAVTKLFAGPCSRRERALDVRGRAAESHADGPDDRWVVPDRHASANLRAAPEPVNVPTPVSTRA